MPFLAPGSSVASVRWRSRSRASSTRYPRTWFPTSSSPRPAAPPAFSRAVRRGHRRLASVAPRRLRGVPRRLERRRRSARRSSPRAYPSSMRACSASFPAACAEPLWLRGRVLGLLLCVGAPLGSLADIAKQGAAALELANDYTDYIEAARRRKPTTPAAEIQQNLFPPRIARIAGAQLAGVAAPELRGRRRLVRLRREPRRRLARDRRRRRHRSDRRRPRRRALGALRAARRSGKDLEEALTEHGQNRPPTRQPRLLRHRLLARWRAATATLTWVNCGHPPAYLIDTDGELERTRRDRSSRRSEPRTANPTYKLTERQLHSGERLILLTDGITERRRMEDGETFGSRRHPASARARRQPNRRLDRDGDPTGGHRLLARAARGRRHHRRNGHRMTDQLA